MQDLIKGVLEICIARNKTRGISVGEIKFVLMTRFKKRSLIYPHVAKGFLKTFCDIATRLGYGKFDLNTQRFILNTEHEDISSMFIKYEIPLPAKKDEENSREVR